MKKWIIIVTLAAWMTAQANSNTLISKETLDQISTVSEIVIKECLNSGNTEQDCYSEGKKLWFEIGTDAVKPCKSESESFDQLYTCVNTKVLELLIERFPEIINRMEGPMGHSI